MVIFPKSRSILKYSTELIDWIRTKEMRWVSDKGTRYFPRKRRETRWMRCSGTPLTECSSFFRAGVLGNGPRRGTRCSTPRQIARHFGLHLSGLFVFHFSLTAVERPSSPWCVCQSCCGHRWGRTATQSIRRPWSDGRFSFLFFFFRNLDCWFWFSTDGHG